ncbi:MAG: ribbon-helix-helix protein, CopG family [Paraburkholderia sp.]|uniref:CopG family ribbon-helix-helix protein n=1 Tax=Paraburkholderia sp. TaxID=1926495 RepID=UPI001226510A|nr:ribbon-helix-helix protein, CopG family [Paraburkholderia sp.]TAL96066.1 MAG: ribbon-helix-helix protein, CopG family [Paraburkholderia sp.]
MATKTFTAHVPAELAELVDALAQRWDRPRGWVVNRALTDLVEQENERDRLTRIGLESSRAGRTVPHEQVRAWIKSLNTDQPLSLPQSGKGKAGER